ncbi:MAG: hypothetical protein MI922_07460 [Bacteroidales bacterium]|nr:hypothetical protein [Bacteroidales bacterium]
MLIGIKLNKKTFIRWKVYIDRARMYIGYIQFFMIGIVFFDRFKDKTYADWISSHAIIAIPVMFVLFMGISLILGYLDSKLGFRKEELRNASTSNPVLMEILDTVTELKEKIDKD